MSFYPCGQKVCCYRSEGNQTTHIYDEADWLSQVTNAETRTTACVYDEFGRIYQVTDAKNQTSRQITYTDSCLKETEIDANGNTTQYSNDYWGSIYHDHRQPDQSIYPDNSYESYAWDDAGNQTSLRVPMPP